MSDPSGAGSEARSGAGAQAEAKLSAKAGTLASRVRAARASLIPRSLTAQLIGLISLALLPLGLIAMYQTAQVITEAQRVSQSALQTQTERVAAAHRVVMANVMGVAQGLGHGLGQGLGRGLDQDGPIQDGLATSETAACTAMLTAFADGSNETGGGPVRAVAAVALDGQILCASRSLPAEVASLITRTVGQPAFDFGPLFRVIPAPSADEVPLVVAITPLVRRGVSLGSLAVAAPLQIAPLGTASPDTKPEVFVLDATSPVPTRAVLPSSLAAQTPPRRPYTYFSTRMSAPFAATDTAGIRRVYSVRSLSLDGAADAAGPDDLLLIGSWPARQPLSTRLERQVWIALGFPATMWIVGVLVAYLGVQRLMVRHVRRLRDTMRRFALGERQSPFLTLDHPPEELAEAERAFNRMATILMDAEVRAEEDVQQKTVLLREVHHRVKNNLQMIVSIMNMQARNATTPEAEEILAQLQRRIRGLASIHRSFYATTDVATVDARALIDRLASEVLELGAASERVRPEVTLRLDPLDLYPDQAVPTSMLVSEAVTNAVKYAGLAGSEKVPRIEVTLTVGPEGAVRLSIFNSRSPVEEGAAEPTHSTGLGMRLMRAFVIQLEGEMQVDDTPDGYRLTVQFQRQDFDAGEARLNPGRRGS